MNEIRKICSEQSKNPEWYKCFLPVEVNGFKMSIQGSDFHYCRPRQILDNLAHYELVEFAIIGTDNEFVTDKDFTCKSPLESLSSDGGVFGYASWDDVQAVYDFLKNYGKSFIEI